jgi:tetratricopeptide (TPR) repeat protein
LKAIFLPFLFFLLLVKVDAQSKVDFTPLAVQAYNNILDLRIVQAQANITLIKKQDPNNLVVLYLENYIDCIIVFVSENEVEFNRLKKNKDIRLDKLKKIKTESPFNDFIRAEINLQWAMARMKFKEYYTVFNEASEAFELLENNQKKYPTFLANKKSIGVIHALIGTIPGKYKWGVTLLSGMDGTIDQGKKELEEIIAHSKKYNFIFEKETAIMYSFLLLHLDNESEDSWKMINNPKFDASKSMLFSFAKANIAMRTGRSDEAIKILENRPNTKEYYPMPYLEYMIGLTKLSKLDVNAVKHFTSYIQKFRGKFYIKEAYQKIAWCYLVNDNPKLYKANILKCLTVGTAETGGDKNAMKEAKTGEIPELNLLKSRLLFDGGYYQKALDALENKKLTGAKNILEYNYRMGRITQMMKSYDKAILYFNETIEKGRLSPNYFACNAALQLGNIYEDLKQTANAKKYYNICLDINPDDYSDIFHLKAKAGLLRLK